MNDLVNKENPDPETDYNLTKCETSGKEIECTVLYQNINGWSRKNRITQR